jgi:hypothetical protein
MKLWLVQWPNGDKAIVHAKDKHDANFILDEVGDADPRDITEYRGSFFAVFSPTKTEGGCEWTGSGEIAEQVLEALGDAEDAHAKLEEAREDAKQPGERTAQIGKRWEGPPDGEA